MNQTSVPQVGKAQEVYTAHWWQIHAWGIGAIASYFMYEQFYLINNIHTTVFRVNLVWVGIILAIPRLFDGVIDPILGHWSDNMRSRFGRRRPFLLAAAVVGGLTASCMFWMSPDWPQPLKIVILAFSAITLFTACGTYDMAHTALGYELSDAYGDRSRIQAIKSVYWSLVGIVGGFVIWSAGNLHTIGDFLFGSPPHNWLGVWATWRPGLLDASSKSGGNEVVGFRIISGAISLLILFTVLFPLFWSSERFVKMNRKHVNIWKAVGATLSNRPFVVLQIINVTKTAGTLSRNLMFFIGVYSVCYGDKQEYSKVTAGFGALGAFVIALVIWPLTRPVTNLIGKKTALISGAGMAVLYSIGLPFVAIPGHVYWMLYYMLAFQPINHVLGVAAAGIMPDVCDVDELAHGERREGLFTAVQSFISKMEISVMTILTGVFTQWSGFDAGKGANQTPEVLHRLRVMGFGPLIGTASIAFIVSCFMPLTKKMMEKVRSELDARHAAAGLVASAEAAKLDEPNA